VRMRGLPFGTSVCTTAVIDAHHLKTIERILSDKREKERKGEKRESGDDGNVAVILRNVQVHRLSTIHPVRRRQEGKRRKGEGRGSSPPARSKLQQIVVVVLPCVGRRKKKERSASHFGAPPLASACHALRSGREWRGGGKREEGGTPCGL